jgi:hypothetical protein
MTSTSTIPLIAIRNLVEYLYRDEARNFEDDPGYGDHIFHSVKKVADWLDEIKESKAA